jgi:hypothetical protein
MSIQDVTKKINPVVNFWRKVYSWVKTYWKRWVGPHLSLLHSNLNPREDIFIVSVIILVGLAGFGLGKISVLEKSRGTVDIQKASWVIPTATTTTSSVQVADKVAVPVSASAMVATEKALGFLVSSKGGKKYHFPWCAGASQIAEKNKVWFDSYEEAQRAGYTAATNCLGLK